MTLGPAKMKMTDAYCRRVAEINGERYLGDKFLQADLKVNAQTLRVFWSLELYEWMLVLMKYGKVLDITSDLPKHSLKYAKQRYYAKHPDAPRGKMSDFEKKDKDQFMIAVRVGQAKGVFSFLD